VCKCDPVEGVSLFEEKTQMTQGGSKPRYEKELLFDDDLLGDAMPQMDHASPFKTKSGSIPINEPLRKANTMMPGKQP
jgi:hypothetical protein